jgi:hypothetical protein
MSRLEKFPAEENVSDKKVSKPPTALKGVIHTRVSNDGALGEKRGQQTAQNVVIPAKPTTPPPPPPPPKAK